MRRYLPQNYLDSKTIDPKILNQIIITPNDFDLGIKNISKNVSLSLKLMENDKTKDNNN